MKKSNAPAFHTLVDDLLLNECMGVPQRSTLRTTVALSKARLFGANDIKLDERMSSSSSSSSSSSFSSAFDLDRDHVFPLRAVPGWRGLRNEADT